MNLIALLFEWPMGVTAAVLGLLGGLCCWRLTRRVFRQCDEPPRQWDVWTGVGCGLLSAAFVMAMQTQHVQQTPEVRPSAFWMEVRILSHLALFVLLLAATAIDFRAYLIPDSITLPGLLLGLVLATAAGELQIVHVWVDWNQEIPQFRGPYLPAWLSAHPHLHGLAWSAAGAATGAGVVWLLRRLSSLVLGQETLGLGDITLMAMAGSFLGWQPVVVTFLLAPLCAVVVGVLVRMLTNRPFIPYGPYLSLAAVLVLFSWRWIWMFEAGVTEAARKEDTLNTFAVRRLFGDWPSLLILAGGALAGLLLLLGLLRLYRTVPLTGRRERDADRDVI